MKVQANNQGIYRQIAEYGIDQVLSGSWPNGERIPSVRQLAADVGVNPNTVMSAYDYLKGLAIIETQRGRGFFVAKNGREAAIEMRRSAFVNEEIPRLQRTLNLLGISPESLLHLLFPGQETIPS